MLGLNLAILMQIIQVMQGYTLPGEDSKFKEVKLHPDKRVLFRTSNEKYGLLYQDYDCVV